MLPTDIKKLIELVARRLQKRREEQALKGISTPPEVLIEIEDLEAQLDELQARLSQARQAETAAQALLYILTSIRGSWSVEGYKQLTDYKKLETAVQKVSQPDEIVLPHLAQLIHDTPPLRQVFTENNPPPAFAGIAFIDLAQPGAEIVEDMALIRSYLPAVVFILYTSNKEYKRFKGEAPADLAGRLEHYYKLRKGDDLIFETKVREILDIARTTAMQRRDAANAS